jgi:ArsR family transcriptional regulator, arsenate/arsenite/antimonite-responsive transcriptional repressor
MTATLERTTLGSSTAERCCPVVATGGLVDESQAETYASWFKALADPTRIRILNLLASSDEPVCVCELTEQFSFSQATISHHLKVLRDTRFIFSERRGTFMYYRVNRACVSAFPEAARSILNG